MNELQFFHFGDASVRIHIDNDGEPWFVAKDVAVILEIQNVRQNMDMLDEDEKGVCPVYTPGGEQDMLIVSESGLYALIFKSRKPQAKRFRKWVTSEVLPSIRRTGSYSLPKASLPAVANVDSSIFSRLALPEDVLKLNRALRVRLLGIAARITLMDPDQREEAFALFGKLCSITTAEKEKEYEGSPATLFARERLVRSNGKMQARVLYEAFVDWCYSREIVPCSMRRFCTIMRSRFSVHESNRLYFYCAFVSPALSLMEGK